MSNPWDDDDDDFSEEDEKSENPYLGHPESGLALVQNLLERNNSGARAANRVVELIDNRIMPLLHALENAQWDVAETLTRVKTQIAELHKAGILTNRAVLGVGGKFSAGKSCFINSLTDAGLPEGQRATTSIATYIVKSDRTENQAITANDCSVTLDDAAVEALTHEFSRVYGIGFVRVIDNLIIHSSTFRYPNLAILDTPGYSKADSGKNADATDAEIALKQLRSADALVWLMDIENGVINDSDLKFIEALKSKAQILFVFNKADLRPKDTVQQIVDGTKKILQDRPEFSEKTYAVIAYNSFNGETVIGGNALTEFLNEVSSLSGEKMSVAAEVKQAHETAARDIIEHIEKLNKRVKLCESVLGEADSPDRISSIVQEMGSCRETVWRLKNTRESLGRAFHDLSDIINHLLREQGAEKYYVLHVRVPSSWQSVNLWGWNKASGQNAFLKWPGKTLVQKARDWYTVELPEWVNSIVISANREAVHKTDDMVINPTDTWITVYENFSYEIHYSENGGREG